MAALQQLDEISRSGAVAGGEESVGDPGVVAAGGASDAMHVALDARHTHREVVVDHCFDVLLRGL